MPKIKFVYDIKRLIDFERVGVYWRCWFGYKICL